MPKAAIITIGDELLIGQTIDTNSAFVAQSLLTIGFNIDQKITIGDDSTALIQSLENIDTQAVKVVILTGGLGPTKDDKTKLILCQYFDTTLVINPAILEHIKVLFTNVYQQQGTLLATNIQQAAVPKDAIIFFNKKGTAPGLGFYKNDTFYVALPGVPYEMQTILTEEVIPYLKKKFGLNAIQNRHLLTYGIGESKLAHYIEGWEKNLPAYLKLAYLPHYNTVRLRLDLKENSSLTQAKELDTQFGELKKLLAPYTITEGGLSFQEYIAQILIAHKKTIAFAESCTGGALSASFTQYAGSSTYFLGSIIAYANAVKTDILDVPAELIETYGAVSAEVVEGMALAVRKKLKADFGVAISGVMGPAHPLDRKKVGTVWIAVCAANHTIIKGYTFEYDRIKNIQVTVLTALYQLKKLFELEKLIPANTHLG